MIKIMQDKEASAWINLNCYENAFGDADKITKSALREWGEIYRLMEELGIKTKREEA